jgi:hypothetical protein
MDDIEKILDWRFWVIVVIAVILFYLGIPTLLGIIVVKGFDITLLTWLYQRIGLSFVGNVPAYVEILFCSLVFFYLLIVTVFKWDQVEESRRTIH